MNKLSLDEIAKIEDFIQKAGEYLLSFYEDKLDILSEEGRDVKARADQLLEIKIKKFLLENFSYLVLGEEFSESDNFEKLTGFVVDPIDGTMNFVRKNPIFCISIAFLFEGEPLVGIIYNPELKELITGVVGRGVFLNGVKVERTLKASIEQCVVATGIPTHMNTGDLETFHKYLERIKKFKKVRMIGSAAQSTAWIGLGRLDAYYEDSIMLWDVAAGMAIVKASGGIIDFKSSESIPWAYNVRAAINKKILSELI